MSDHNLRPLCLVYYIPLLPSTKLLLVVRMPARACASCETSTVELSKRLHCPTPSKRTRSMDGLRARTQRQLFEKLRSTAMWMRWTWYEKPLLPTTFLSDNCVRARAYEFVWLCDTQPTTPSRTLTNPSICPFDRAHDRFLLRATNTRSPFRPLCFCPVRA